jgi:hypothetical protein
MLGRKRQRAECRAGRGIVIDFDFNSEFEKIFSKVMKKYFVAALLVFSFGLLISAEDKVTRPDIDELLTLTRVQKMSENAIEQMKTMMAGVAKQTNVSPEATEKAKAMRDKMFALIESEMSWDKMKAEYAKVYAEVFTPEEVRGLIAFYKSPSGQAFLDKQPLLMQKTMEMAQKRMMDLTPKIQEMIKQESQATGKGTSKPEPSVEKNLP